MRRFISTLLLGAALIGGTLSLGGCVVVPAHRAYYRGSVWVPAHWSGGIWVRGHYR